MIIFISVAYMCIAIIVRNYSDRFPLIVFHSREEDVDRSTSPLRLHDSILSAVDERSNGVAAVGLNVNTGRFAVLTNCRYRPGLNPNGASRGDLISKILTDSNDDIDVEYQGLFHLYHGNFFGPKTDLVYMTNATRKLEITTVRTQRDDLEVIVRSNEHPETMECFDLKISSIREFLHKKFSTNRDIDSVDAIVSLLEESLNVLDQSLPEIPKDSSFSWSQLSPENESFVLSHIFIPPLSVGGTSKFGTVSHTVMVSDSQSRIVHYWYKSRPTWIWEIRQVHFIDS